jgi:hypothetical protein
MTSGSITIRQQGLPNLKIGMSLHEYGVVRGIKASGSEISIDVEIVLPSPHYSNFNCINTYQTLKWKPRYYSQSACLKGVTKLRNMQCESISSRTYTRSEARRHPSGSMSREQLQHLVKQFDLQPRSRNIEGFRRVLESFSPNSSDWISKCFSLKLLT